MTTIELEGLVKNTLKSYVLDYNRINPKSKIDFNLSLTLHKFDAKQVEGYDPKDEKFATVKELNGQSLYYARISKTLLDSMEKRVIFTSYRPKKKFGKDAANRSMLLEAVRQMMIGGLEYSEAVYQMNQKDKQEKESQKEPQENPV